MSIDELRSFVLIVIKFSVVPFFAIDLAQEEQCAIQFIPYFNEVLPEIVAPILTDVH